MCLIIFAIAGTLGLVRFKEPTTGVAEFPLAPGQTLGISREHLLLTIDDLRSRDAASFFESFSDKQITTKGPDHVSCWIRLPLENRSSEPREYILEVTSRWIDDANLYIPTSNGRYRCRHGGESRHYLDKEIRSHVSAFKIQLEANREQVFYLHLRDFFRINPGIRLWSDVRGFHAYLSREGHFSRVYFGVLIGLLIANFCVFLAFRYRDVQYYLIYVTVYGILQLVNFNIHFYYFFDFFSSIYMHMPSRMNAFLYRGMFVLSAATLLLFANEFLETITFSKRLHRFLNHLSACLLVLAPMVMFGPLVQWGDIVVAIVVFSWASGYLLTFATGVWAAVKGIRQSRYFIPAQLLLIVVSWQFSFATITGQTATAAMTLQWLYASALEMIIFMFGLVDRFIFVNRQRSVAQQQLIEETTRFAQLQKRYNTELQEQVAKRTTALRNAVEQKDRILQIVSHDLKTPLNSIRALSEMMLESPVRFTKDEILDFAADISENTRQLHGNISNLLHWAGTETGQSMVANQTAYLVRDLWEPVIATMSLPAKNRKITIEQVMLENVFVTCNYVAITTVIRNFVDNAVKFTGEHGRIFLANYLIDGEVEFVVEDSGAGMSTEQQEAIRRNLSDDGDFAAISEAGNHLGLRICGNVLRQHNSRLCMDSEPGRGTRMSFFLPKADRPV